MTFKTADDQIVPGPVLRHIHEDSFYKTSEGRRVTLKVLEIRQPAFATLTLTEVTDGYEVFAAEYLTGIVALRLTEGWIIMSASERHYILAAPPPDPAQLHIGPICPRCGSDRIVRDACARWDETTGRWTLADLHDCHFCENCNAESVFTTWPCVAAIPADNPPAVDIQP